jgi:hypothetical protein
MSGPAFQPPQYQGPWETPDPAPASAPPLKRRRNLAIVAGCVAMALALIVVGVFMFLVPSVSKALSRTPTPSPATPSPTPSPSASTTTVTATFSLTDQDTADNACEGQGGYSDISTGASVTIEDQKTEIVGSASLDAGVADADICTWSLSFDNVPLDRTQYTLKIGSRGGLTESNQTLEADSWHFSAQMG